jgi:hypothetical protein
MVEVKTYRPFSAVSRQNSGTNCTFKRTKVWLGGTNDWLRGTNDWLRGTNDWLGGTNDWLGGTKVPSASTEHVNIFTSKFLNIYINQTVWLITYQERMPN